MWLHSCSFVGYCFQSLFKRARSFVFPHLICSPSVSLKFRWCNHTVVMTRQQFRRNPVLLASVHASSMRMLTSFSVDEILQQGYIHNHHHHHHHHHQVVPTVRCSLSVCIFLIIRPCHPSTPGRFIMAKEIDCGLEVSGFELQSYYCVHLLTNTLGRGMNPFINLSMG